MNTDAQLMLDKINYFLKIQDFPVQGLNCFLQHESLKEATYAGKQVIKLNLRRYTKNLGMFP